VDKKKKYAYKCGCPIYLSAPLQFIFVIHLLASLETREICDYIGDRLPLIRLLGRNRAIREYVIGHRFLLLRKKIGI
jgi:hypothetical protein